MGMSLVSPKAALIGTPRRVIFSEDRPMDVDSNMAAKELCGPVGILQRNTAEARLGSIDVASGICSESKITKKTFVFKKSIARSGRPDSFGIMLNRNWRQKWAPAAGPSQVMEYIAEIIATGEKMTAFGALFTHGLENVVAVVRTMDSRHFMDGIELNTA